MIIKNDKEYACDSGWSSAEFFGCDFGDERLKKRVVKVSEALSRDSVASINEATEDWAAAKGAYRLFSNSKVTCDELLHGHLECTKRRLREEDVVLAVQDTTHLSFANHHKCEGLGFIKSEKKKGVIVHNTLAITPNGLPLGLLRQEKYSRFKLKRSGKHGVELSPVEKKESFRWIKALRETEELCSKAKKVVTICDREADFYELLVEAERLQSNYVIRARTPRKILDNSSQTTLEALEAKDPVGTIEVNVPARAGDKKRIAKLAVRFIEVILQPPQRRSVSKEFPELLPVTVSLISVKEIEVRKGISALNWVLLSNEKIHSLEDAIEKISWYKARWHIESYHKVLKSGCAVESSRLENIDALQLYITMCGIIAWRIYWFTHISRTKPDASPRILLAKVELETLSLLAGRKKKTPLEIKNAKQAVLEIAKLGGFLARRHDGLPGPRKIWVGFRRLSEAAQMYEIMTS